MPDTKLVICKTCKKEFEVPLESRASICSECKKKRKAEARKKRKATAEKTPAKKPNTSKANKQPVKKNKPSPTVALPAIAESINKGLDLDSLFPPEIWEERPVDIETFLFNRDYLGNAWLDGDGNKTMFPSWQDYAKKIFPLPMKSPYNTVILSGATGLGKQQPNSCEVLTPTGSIKFGDIKVGDEILGLDGKPQRVVGVFPQTERRVYEVVLNDGSSTRCGPEHLWTVGLKSHGKIKWQTLTLEEILKKAEHRGRFGCRGGKAVLLPRIQPVEYPEKNFKCDPYVLGALLGDGVLRTGKHKDRPLTLSSGDSDIPSIFGSRLNSSFKKCSLSYNWNFSIGGRNIKQSAIVPDELQGLGSYDKYIPEEYFYGSVQQRLDLLRGLMDTDGSALPAARGKGRSKCHFSSVSKALAEGVVRLARSLGMFATVKEYHRIKTYKGVSKEKTSYGVSINSDTFCPFLIERKASIWTPAKQFVNRKFREVKYWGEEDSTCIKVSNPDEMYLTNDYIPTHNTSIAMGVCCAYYLYIVMCLRNPHEYFGLADQKPIIFANINIVTKTMAYKNAWGMIHKMLISSPWFMQRGNKTTGKRQEWYCTTKPVELIYGRGPDDLIGLDILFCFMDEISFYRNQSVEKQIEAATEVFNSAWERMKSRYIKFGGIFDGLMVMASSKRTDQSFMESFIKTITDGVDARRVLIIDRARWEMLPESSYSGKKFPVAVGDKFRPSQIIKEEQLEEFKNAGYKIIWPPIENYAEFERDMNNALTNIAGISVGQISSFIRGDLVTSCIDDRYQNLITKSVIFSGYKDPDQYYEYVDLSRMSPEDFTLPLFVHLDASLGRDGNSIVGVVADYAVNQANSFTGNYEVELHYRELFKLKIRAPQGTHTGLNKNKQFILWLNQHFNLQGVSRDQYQSEEFHQDLDRLGIKVTKQSIDSVTNGICLTGDTLVMTPQGSKRIDELRAGDEVISYNLDRDKGEVEKISWWGQTAEVDEYLKIRVGNGKQQITCTPNHLILTERGYIRADELKKSDRIIKLRDSKKWYTNGVEEIVVSEYLLPPVGYKPGRLPLTEETRRKLSKPATEETKNKLREIRKNNPLMTITNGEEDRRVPKGSEIPTGWRRGSYRCGEKSHVYGRKLTPGQIFKLNYRPPVYKVSEETRLKISKGNKRRVSPTKGKTWSAGTREKMKKIHSEMDWVAAKKKEYETKKLNNSFNSSLPEEEFAKLHPTYIRQYRDPRYPFACDFYDPDTDTFIELNLSWVHGPEPFDPKNSLHRELLEKWIEKSKKSKYFEIAVKVWTDLDPKKVEISKNNNIRLIRYYRAGRRSLEWKVYKLGL